MKENIITENKGKKQALTEQMILYASSCHQNCMTEPVSEN